MGRAAYKRERGSALQLWSVTAAVIRCKVVDDDLGIDGPNWRTERRDHFVDLCLPALTVQK
jgi:hypothetical protein